MKLSICSRYRQKSDDQVNTEKYRNSTLNLKKLHWNRIGAVSADTQNFLYRIGFEKIVSLHP